MTEIRMPKLGLTMEEGTVVAWLKSEGDAVAKGEPVLEVESDKAVVQVEAPADGILKRILVRAGMTAPIGSVLAYIGESNEVVSESSSSGPADELTRADIGHEGADVRATPRARKLAQERGVRLSDIRGSGPSGRITETDVLRYAREQSDGLPQSEGLAVRDYLAPSKVKAKMARQMTQSVREAPQFSETIQIDMTNIIGVRESIPAELDRPSITAYIVRATALALDKFRLLNATLSEDGRIAVFEDINVGVATSARGDLYVLVIRNADRKTVREINTELSDLVRRARSEGPRPGDMQGGTFTVSNLGMYNVHWFTPIINPPQAGILGIGACNETPVVRDGRIVALPIIRVTLVGDHRIVDGAYAAEFLSEFRRLVETAEFT